MSPGRHWHSRDSLQQAARRNRSKLFTPLVALAALGVAGAVVLAVTWTALLMFTPREEIPTPAERKLIVDIRAVAGQIDGYVPERGRESLLQHRYFDHSFQIEYTYAAARSDALYVKSTLCVARSPADAARLYRRSWDIQPWKLLLAGDQELGLGERNDLFRWGDESRLWIVSVAGRPAGNLFVARKGDAVFFLLVSGVCFDRPEAFASLVRPVLSRIEGRQWQRSLPPLGR